MKAKISIILVLSLVIGAGVTSCKAVPAKTQLSLYDLENNISVNDNRAIDRLKQASIVLVGEHHSDPMHHEIQLAVIRNLKEAGTDVAVGLEMFREENQAALDQWVAGELSEKEFTAIYFENWNFPWKLYRSIFIYAREHKIDLVGLNVASGITRQVAYHGYASLDEEQKAQIGNVSCDVSSRYRKFIQNAFGDHVHGQLNFTNFCEAQLIWDTVMARNALDYLNKHPRKKLIILSGTGHARKLGIPEQINKRSSLPVVVVLPETAGSINSQNTGFDDADYLYLKP